MKRERVETVWQTPLNNVVTVFVSAWFSYSDQESHDAGLQLHVFLL
jgi:hypothetical protein